MKKYKLLKDLPFAKAGDIFKGKLEYGTTVLFPEDYENYKHKLSSDEFWDFDEWFEEIEEYFTINTALLFVVEVNSNRSSKSVIENLKSIGLLFKTEEKTKKYLAYLKAKEVLKQDTKGFKPDWRNTGQYKFFGRLLISSETLDIGYTNSFIEASIYFKSREDIKESFEKHPKEWETYLTYEQ